jgi:hypothetical protein
VTGAVRHRARIRLLGAAAALVTAWLVTPHAIPLYDGIGVPDEPYRYVSPPAGYQKTPAASSVSVPFAATNGTNPKGGLVQTAEVSSQSGMYFLPNGLKGPTSTKTFTISITPEAPSGSTPGAVDGNVYRIAFLADGKAGATLTATGRNTVYIQRATSAKVAAADLYYRPAGGSWTTIPDTKGGTDSFQGYFAGPGDYALVPTKAAKTSSSHVLLIVILVLVVVAMAGAVVLIRLSRRPPTRT